MLKVFVVVVEFRFCLCYDFGTVHRGYSNKLLYICERKALNVLEFPFFR